MAALAVRIPIHCGARILEVCDAISVQRYLRAANLLNVIRARKSGNVVRVFLQEDEGGLLHGKDVESDALQHSGPNFDNREYTREGIAFEQALTSGRVWALGGVTGSESGSSGGLPWVEGA